MTTPVLALAALLVVVWPPSWRATRQVVTIVHEGGHALVAVASGRRLHGVRLHRDSSGVTTHRGLATGFGMVLTVAAGYPAPALLGLGGAALISQGYAVWFLWVVLAALAWLLLQIRNMHGVLVVLAAGAGLVAVTVWVSPARQAMVAEALAWFLMLGAVRTVVELQGHRRRHRGLRTDADQLARVTPVPGLVWVTVFLVVAAACLAAGGWLLA